MLLGPMGGPFWSRKDAAAWSIPTGMLDEGEEPVAAARREFTEELGFPPPTGELRELGSVVQSGRRKTVIGYALAGDVAAELVTAVAERPDVGDWVEIEWPRNSGRILRFPEIDRAGWFDLETARTKLVKGQRPFLDRLVEQLSFA